MARAPRFWKRLRGRDRNGDRSGDARVSVDREAFAYFLKWPTGKLTLATLVANVVAYVMVSVGLVGVLIATAVAIACTAVSAGYAWGRLAGTRITSERHEREQLAAFTAFMPDFIRQMEDDDDVVPGIAAATREQYRRAKERLAELGEE